MWSTVNIIVDFLYGLDDFLLQLDFFWIYLENLEIIVCTKYSFLYNITYND